MSAKIELPVDLTLYVWKLSQRVQQIENQLQQHFPTVNTTKVKVEFDADKPVSSPSLSKSENKLNFDDLVFHQIYNDTFEAIYGPQPRPKTANDPPQRSTFQPPAPQPIANKPAEANHILRVCTICKEILPADSKDKTIEFFTHQTKAHFFYGLDKTAIETETKCKINDCKDTFSTRNDLIVHMGVAHGLSKFIMDRVKEAMKPYGGLENNGYKCFVEECLETSPKFTIGQLLMHLTNVHYSNELLKELAKYRKYQNVTNLKHCPIDFCSVKHDKENDMVNHLGVEHCAVWGITAKTIKSARSIQTFESLSKIVLAFSESIGTTLTTCKKEKNGEKCMHVSPSKKWHIYHLMTIHGSNPKTEESEEDIKVVSKPAKSNPWFYLCPIESKHKFNKDNDEERSENALLAHLCEEHFEPEFEKALEDKYPNCPSSDKCKSYKFMQAIELKQHMKVKHPEFLMSILQSKFPDFKFGSCLHEDLSEKTKKEQANSVSDKTKKEQASSAKEPKNRRKTKNTKHLNSPESSDRLFELYREYCSKKGQLVDIVNISHLNNFINEVSSNGEASTDEIETLLGMFDAMAPGTSKNRTIVRTLKSLKGVPNEPDDKPKPKRAKSSNGPQKSSKQIKSEIEVTENLADDLPDLPLV